MDLQTLTDDELRALVRFPAAEANRAIGYIPEDVSKGYLEVVEPAVVDCRHVSFFHERGDYADRDLHISA